MERNRRAAGLAAAAAMLILILDGKTALTGAAEGISLCIGSVIPALFPFFFLTPILVGTLSPAPLKPLAKWMGLPSGMEGILIPAFLGGYPMGAQAVGRAWKEGSLTRSEAYRALHFCSNAGPSFLFGIIGPQFSSPAAAWILWAVHILCAVLVSFTIPKIESRRTTSLSLQPVSLQQALMGAVKTTGVVCGWVVLFRIAISFLNRWVLWVFPPEIHVFVSGLLELSNGCCMLSGISSQQIRFIFCTGLLNFGGCCVAMQTAAVTPGLSILPYLKGKLMQTVYALSISSLLLPGLSWKVKWILILPSIVMILTFGTGTRKNNSSNPGLSVV